MIAHMTVLRYLLIAHLVFDIAVVVLAMVSIILRREERKRREAAEERYERWLRGGG